MDDTIRRAAEVMDHDILDDILRNDGIAGVLRGMKLMGELAELGIKKEMIGTVLKTQGVEGLVNLKLLCSSGKVTLAVLEDIITKGIQLDDVIHLINSGIDVLDLAKYGIENGTEAKCFIELLKQGDRKDVIEALGRSGYKPSGMMGVIEGATEALAKINVDVRKFSEYIFRAGGCDGKEVVYNNLGYFFEDSGILTQIYKEQASIKYSKGEYTLGKPDQYG